MSLLTLRAHGPCGSLAQVNEGSSDAMAGYRGIITVSVTSSVVCRAMKLVLLSLRQASWLTLVIWVSLRKPKGEGM